MISAKTTEITEVTEVTEIIAIIEIIERSILMLFVGSRKIFESSRYTFGQESQNLHAEISMSKLRAKADP
jgi:hypothetical protein